VSFGEQVITFPVNESSNFLWTWFTNIRQSANFVLSYNISVYVFVMLLNMVLSMNISDNLFGFFFHVVHLLILQNLYSARCCLPHLQMFSCILLLILMKYDVHRPLPLWAQMLKDRKNTRL